MIESTQLRCNLVNNLLKPNGIKNPRILHAFQEVPRETFIDKTLLDNSYGDGVSPFSEVRMLKPLVIAKILQAMQVKASDKILIIGPYTLYTAALLSYCCHEITVICQSKKIFQRLIDQASRLSGHSILLQPGLLIDGFSQGAPYDQILIEGGIELSIDTLKNQVKIGGNLLYLKPIDSYLGYRVIKEAKNSEHTSTPTPLFECDGYMLNEFKQVFTKFEM